MCTLQQLSFVLGFYNLPFIIFGDFNMAPEVFSQCNWANNHHATQVVPDTDTTCKGSKYVIDYWLVSNKIMPLVRPPNIDTTSTWKPHQAWYISLFSKPMRMRVHRLLAPAP